MADVKKIDTDVNASAQSPAQPFDMDAALKELSALSRPTVAFNESAAGVVYANAETLDYTFFGGVDKDNTIKFSSVETNLSAFKAGYAGTSMEETMNTFANTILKHDDLKAGMGALLKDEGKNVISGIQSITGEMTDGDMDLFAKQMEDPTRRKMFSDMMVQVGKHEYGMEHAVAFTTKALAAAKDPTNMKKSEDFLQVAHDIGVDTTDIEQQSMMDMLKDFWNNPEKAIGQFMASLNLPPEIAQGLTGLISPVVGFYKESINYYANGEGNQPGLIDIGKDAWEKSKESGADIFAKNNITAPAPIM